MKKILFISPFSPFSGSNGSGERVSQLMISAQKLGHEVHFFHLPGWDKVHQNCIDFLTEDKCHTVPSLKRKNSVAEELKSFSDEVVNFLKNYREELPTAVFDYLSHFATPKVEFSSVV